MTGPDDWDAEKEYDVGFDQALKGIDFTIFWTENTEWKNEMNDAYTLGYQAGRKQVLINLIKEDPK